MKKISVLIAVLLFAVLLCGCADNKRCESDAALQRLEAAEPAKAFVYGKEEGYTISGSDAARLLGGNWTPASKPDEMNKAISFIIDTQYEICLFENGQAMIYSGYAGFFESDRTYYECTLDNSLDDIISYISENGVAADINK